MEALITSLSSSLSLSNRIKWLLKQNRMIWDHSGQSGVSLTSHDADLLLVQCDVSGAPHCSSLFCSIKTLQLPQSFLSTVTDQEPFLQTPNLRLSHEPALVSDGSSSSSMLCLSRLCDSRTARASRLSRCHCPTAIEGRSVSQHCRSHSDSIWPRPDTM